MFSLNSMRNRFHNTNMGKTIAIGGGLATLVLAVSGIGSNLLNRGSNMDRSTATPVNPNVATINGIPLTRSTYQNALDQQKHQVTDMGQTLNPFSMYQVRMSAFDQAKQAIEVSILAKNAGITVTDSDLAAERAKNINSMKSQLALPANATESDVNAKLQQLSGHTIDDYIDMDSLRSAILITKYQAMVKTTNTPTPNQVIASFRKVHTLHILISNKTRPDAQAKALAEDLTKKIQAGADFKKLAMQYTDDPGSKKSGGDDGFVGTDTPYVHEFLDAAMQLKDGQTTPEPVLSPSYGYFIIQSIGSTEKLPADFQDNKATYTQQVAVEMQSDAEKAALKSVDDSAKVVITDPLVQAYHDMGVDNITPAQVKNVIANLQGALPNASFTDKAEIYAWIGVLYGRNKDNANAIAALKNSVQSQPDASVYMALGEAYQQNKDKADALLAFESASAHAYADPQTHEQLASIYTKMGKADLAKTETKWVATYMASQRNASSQLGSPVQVKTNQ